MPEENTLLDNTLWQTCIANRSDILIAMLMMGMLYFYYIWVKWVQRNLQHHDCIVLGEVDQRNEVLYRTKSQYSRKPKPH